jgi:phosphate/sulfate permease
MADFFKKKKTIIILIGIMLGLAGGLLYWKFIGCTSGTCPITSNWYISTLFGGIFGYLIADSIKIKDKKQEEKEVNG